MTIHTRVIHIHTTPNYNWRIISHCCHYYYILDYFFHPLYPSFIPSPLLCSYKIFIICSFTLLRFAIAARLFRFIVSRSPLAKSSVVNALNLLLLLSHFHPRCRFPAPPPHFLFASKRPCCKCSGSKCEANGCSTAPFTPPPPPKRLLRLIVSFVECAQPQLSSVQTPLLPTPKLLLLRLLRSGWRRHMHSGRRSIEKCLECWV